jgi:mercuric ion transport protein
MAKAEAGSLITSAVGGVLASACCAGPLILVSLGLGGAWVSNLTVLEPYRWIFLGVAVAALLFARRRIFRPVQECQPGEMCAAPRTRRAYRAMFWAVAALVVLATIFPYLAPVFY